MLRLELLHNSPGGGGCAGRGEGVAEDEVDSVLGKK